MASRQLRWPRSSQEPRVAKPGSGSTAQAPRCYNDRAYAIFVLEVPAGGVGVKP